MTRDKKSPTGGAATPTSGLTTGYVSSFDTDATEHDTTVTGRYINVIDLAHEVC